MREIKADNGSNPHLTAISQPVRQESIDVWPFSNEKPSPFHFPKRVDRARLSRKLNEALAAAHPLILVSAPAGFGKTTCISAWIETVEACPVAWLSLDSMDNDPARFFTYLCAALQTVDGRLGVEVSGMLRAGQLPAAEKIVESLLGEIQETDGPFLLVLDDFHVIQNSLILQVLEKMIANPPAAMHLVIITREDPPLPVARLRAHARLTEIRAEDLRFTASEGEAFLNAVMNLGLAPADVAALEERTEGWIAGLQLAGLSVRDRGDRSAFISHLSGSHRFILSYLTEEVLSRQSEDTQQFLLETSILDRLCGDLCNWVTGRSNSQALLEQFFTANLFLISLDEEQKWYRYHHLFADLLRNRQNTLHKDRTAELNRRASLWYVQAGMLSEAMAHAIAAADYAAAVQLLEAHATEMLIQGYAKTVEEWMQAIPLEWRSQSPKASLAFAWKHLLHGDILLVFPYVERLQVIFSGSQGKPEADPSLKAEWLALRSTLLSWQGQPVESIALARQALEIVPEQDGYVRSLIYMGMAGAYQQTGDYDRSLDAFQKIIRYGQSGGNFISEMLGISGLVQMALQHGKYRLAFEVASRGIERVEQLGFRFTDQRGRLRRARSGLLPVAADR